MKKYKYSRKEWLEYYENNVHIHITQEAKEDLLAKESNEEYSQRIMMEQVPKQEDNKECIYGPHGMQHTNSSPDKECIHDWRYDKTAIDCVNCVKCGKMERIEKINLTPSQLDEKQKPYRCSTCNGWIGEGGGTCKCSIPSPLEIEEIETLKHRFMSGKNHCWRELSLQDKKINSLIRNQKKLYQYIKEIKK